MSVVVTARTFYDEFTGTGGGGVDYLNLGVTNKGVCKIEFYTYLAALNQRLTFDSASKTITNSNTLDNTSFIQNGWKVGMTIAVENTVSNNGTYTITRVQDRIITVAEALVDELDEDCDFYDDTPITDLDFYFNIVPNVSQETYASLSDKGTIQRFIATGLDASDATPINFKVGTNSWAWVTNNIIDTDTGETDEITIEGAGISAHKQSFIIYQTFSVAPFWTTAQFSNFQNNLPPDYYMLPSNMKHIFRCDAKFNSGSMIPHTGGITNEAGLSCWFNANNQNRRIDYSIKSVAYSIAGNSVDEIDIKQTTDVTIVIRSNSGAFVYSAPSAPSTAICLEFLFNDLVQTDIVNTQTTLRQNLLNDRLFFEISDSIQNGEFYATDYQVIRSIQATYDSANQITLTFQVEFSTFLQDKLAELASTNRNYSFVITTQDYSIATTEQSDRVALKTDILNAAYNQDNAALLNSAVNNFKVFSFPDIAVNNTNTVGGWQGDAIYAQFPFNVESTEVDGVSPTLMTSGLQIVAVKTGEDDFVIEEKVFDTSAFRKVGTVQQIDIAETRNFKDLPDEYNQSTLVNDSSFDSGSMAGFVISHAFILRYEYWLEIIRTSEQWKYPIYDDLSPTEQWTSLIGDGWTLQLKFVASVKGYDDYITDFWTYTDIAIKDTGDAPDGAPTFTAKIEFYDLDDNLIGTYNPDVAPYVSQGSLLINQKTKIKITYTGNFATMPSGYGSFYASLFIDLLDSGGINNRRFASSQYNSDEDSPFSAVDFDVLADQSFGSDNLTVNIFGNSIVTVETYYDDSVTHWGINNEGIQIYPKLGFIGGEVMLFEDGTEMSFEDGSLMLYEY